MGKSFSVDIVLRHPSRSPESISEALSLKPKSAYGVGQNLGAMPAKRTFFQACLQEALASSDYEDALTKVGQFLEKNAAFWSDFIGGNGEVELILNHAIEPQEEEGDKILELLGCTPPVCPRVSHPLQATTARKDRAHGFR